MRHYDLGLVDMGAAVERYQDIGFDLDGVCSGIDGAGPSCVVPAYARGVDMSDGPGGRDNGFAHNLYVSHFVDRSQDDAESGNGTNLIVIDGDTGAADDDQVGVSLYGGRLAGFPGASPVWDGSDTWKAHDRWVDPAGDAGARPAPVFRDGAAYVVGGTLVARFPALVVGDSPYLTMNLAVVSARLSPQSDATWALSDGVVAGRLKASDLLAAAPFTVGANGSVLCDPADYEAYKSDICAYVDLSSNGKDDGTAVCDASSWGWAFDGSPAIVSGVDPYTESDHCDGGRPPAGDTCDSLEP
jgi:hypothetical protein